MKNISIDGPAIVYCEGAFDTANGKTAHGLVRFTERYEVLSVIDSNCAGRDAGMILDGKNSGIPVVASLHEAMKSAAARRKKPLTLVMGLAPDGGRLSNSARDDLKMALLQGFNIDSGLHDFLTEDREMMALARQNHCRIRDVRKTPERKDLHFFSGKIEQVKCLKLAILGTDSAVGKRTTAWKIVHGFRQAGFEAELIGTGQTAWMQGARYSLILDSLINDFVSGEIEHAVFQAWQTEKPDVLIIEGQGSLMNPAYPGGFEILAAARPDYVILQHAPKRLEYDGFPGYPLHSLSEQIQAIEVISKKKVIAVTVNHELMSPQEIAPACQEITAKTSLPAYEVLTQGVSGLIEQLRPLVKSR